MLCYFWVACTLRFGLQPVGCSQPQWLKVGWWEGQGWHLCTVASRLQRVPHASTGIKRSMVENSITLFKNHYCLPKCTPQWSPIHPFTQAFMHQWVLAGCKVLPRPIGSNLGSTTCPMTIRLGWNWNLYTNLPGTIHQPLENSLCLLSLRVPEEQILGQTINAILCVWTYRDSQLLCTSALIILHPALINISRGGRKTRRLCSKVVKIEQLDLDHSQESQHQPSAAFINVQRVNRSNAEHVPEKPYIRREQTFLII